MEMIQADSREGWLAARTKRLTASDAAAVLGHSPWRSPLEVWAEKTGRGNPVEETERMRLGRYLEPAILARYAADTDLEVVPNGNLYAASDHPWLGATPDAFVLLGGAKVGLAQAKATSKTWDDGEVPLHYQIQAAVEMIVTDLPWDDFPTLVAGASYVCPRVERHRNAEDHILEGLYRFWHSHVLADTPPDPKGDDMKAWLRLVPYQPKRTVTLPPSSAGLFAAMREAEAAAKVQEQRAKDIRASLLAACGDAEVGVIPGTGYALKRSTVSVPEKIVKPYTFEKVSFGKVK